MSDINTALVDRLKALDPNRPIREADITCYWTEPMSSRGNLINQKKTRYWPLHQSSAADYLL